MKDKQQKNMEVETQKHETKPGKGILHKRNKEIEAQGSDQSFWA